MYCNGQVFYESDVMLVLLCTFLISSLIEEAESGNWDKKFPLRVFLLYGGFAARKSNHFGFRFYHKEFEFKG